MPKGCKAPTLCWDCAKAMLGCSWSREFIPVEGWTAEPTVLHSGNAGQTDSYVVHKCPEFVRDSWDGGARRMEEGAKKDEIHL